MKTVAEILAQQVADADLAPDTDQATNEAAAGRAWQRFRAHRLRAARPRSRFRALWLGLAAAALVGALGFTPAGRSVLSIFRVTQVAALPFDASSDAPLASGGTMQLLRQMLADNVTVTLDEKKQSVASATDAARLAGFVPRVPVAWSDAAFVVDGGKDFHMLIDRARAEQVLNDAGLVGVSLPASIDGGVVAVHLPRALTISGGGAVLHEGPSPVVSLPQGLDMRKIAVVGLQLLGMSEAEAEQYCATIDWTSTLVVPFPRQEAESKPVTVDGVEGILLTRSGHSDGDHYVLLWTRQGMLYSIAGSGDGSQGLRLAGSLSAN
jgi:hypothetical protein